MRKVGIIGVGHVGATVAYTLFTHGTVDEMVLIDKNEDKVNAEYNDLHDTLARNNYYVNISHPDRRGSSVSSGYPFRCRRRSCGGR